MRGATKWALAAGLVLAAGMLLKSAWAAEHTKDTLEQVRERLAEGEAVLVDVREQGEWDAGHLAAALLLPLSELTARHEEAEFQAELSKKLKANPKLIVYTHCRSGKRCLAAAELLKQLGYDVRPLKAGYQQLLEKGFEKAAEQAK